MLRILVPVDDSGNSLHAVRHASDEFMKNGALEIHLLNVEAPFSQYISRFASKKVHDAFYRDQPERALLPGGQMLGRFGVPFEVHMAREQKPFIIADLAWRHPCDHIVISTARKNALIRMIENSKLTKIKKTIELTTVPVKTIAGDPVSPPASARSWRRCSSQPASDYHESSPWPPR